MSEVITEELAGSNGHSEDTTSLMASLRARREALGAERRLELDIPGYQGLLAARYKPIEWPDVSKISERVNRSNSPRADVFGAADLLIACCVEMLTRVDGEYVPLNQAGGDLDLGDEPVKYEERLADAFGFEASSAREVVLGLFRNDFAVIDHHRVLLGWLRESGDEVEADF